MTLQTFWMVLGSQSEIHCTAFKCISVFHAVMNQMFITVNIFSYDTLLFLVGGWAMGKTPQTQYIKRITVLGG
jgi:hypothetical protein